MCNFYSYYYKLEHIWSYTMVKGLSCDKSQYMNVGLQYSVISINKHIPCRFIESVKPFEAAPCCYTDKQAPLFVLFFFFVREMESLNSSVT